MSEKQFSKLLLMYLQQSQGRKKEMLNRINKLYGRKNNQDQQDNPVVTEVLFFSHLVIFDNRSCKHQPDFQVAKMLTFGTVSDSMLALEFLRGKAGGAPKNFQKFR